MIRLEFLEAQTQVFSTDDGSRMIELTDPHSGITVRATFPAEAAAIIASALTKPVIELASPGVLEQLRPDLRNGGA